MKERGDNADKILTRVTGNYGTWSLCYNICRTVGQHFYLLTLWMVDKRGDPEVGDFGDQF